MTSTVRTNNWLKCTINIGNRQKWTWYEAATSADVWNTVEICERRAALSIGRCDAMPSHASSLLHFCGVNKTPYKRRPTKNKKAICGHSFITVHWNNYYLPQWRNASKFHQFITLSTPYSFTSPQLISWLFIFCHHFN